MNELKDRGIDVKTTVTTVQEAKEEILALLKERRLEINND